MVRRVGGTTIATRGRAKKNAEKVDEDGPTMTVHRNEVVMVGRLTTAALSRELPSGDTVMTWRILVDRPPGTRRDDGRGQDYDLIDCTSWLARIRRSAQQWHVGDIIELHGALRRRFWRAPGGMLQSRCELEVSSAKRVISAEGQVTRRRKTG